MLKDSGIRDELADDGLSGFAIALIKQNEGIVISMLNSELQPRENIIYWAQEFLNVKDRTTVQLQRTIKEALKSLEVKVPKYPFVNPEVEKQERYFKNKIWLKEQLLQLGHEDNVNLTNIINSHLILGEFCISQGKESTSDKSVMWKLQQVKLLSCIHQDDRYIT